MREERERLANLLESKTVALEESRASQEAMAKKMRLREKRIKQLEEERVQVGQHVQVWFRTVPGGGAEMNSVKRKHREFFVYIICGFFFFAEGFWNVYLLMTDFDHFEVTLSAVERMLKSNC